MHYIRCLRAPKVSLSGRTALLDLTFTITTDLGDAFLFPEAPIGLVVTAHSPDDGGKRAWPLAGKGQLSWKGGQRIAKPTLRLPQEAAKAFAAGRLVEICISTDAEHAAVGTRDVLGLDRTGGGLVMPVWLVLNGQFEEDAEISFRRLDYTETADGSPMTLDISEEIGESIARHIWDGGLMATCALLDSISPQDTQVSESPCVRKVRDLLSGNRPLNILEVGCGVGILGMGIARLCAALRADVQEECVLLMTDLPEAEHQARSNMARLPKFPNHVYENMDWEDGRQGQFGDQVTSRSWDLIVLSDCTYNVDMLPALVETLSALHKSSQFRAANGQELPTTRVFLATKPRHSSEQALFDLLEQHQWKKQEEQILPLPVIGLESETVELYLFEKK